jgi:integrase
MSKIDEFLRMYEGKGTFGVYRWAIGEFFKTVDVDSDHYFTDHRNYEEDVKNFLQQISSKPPKTVRLMISVVKGFLIENNVELSERFWRRLKSKINGHRALTLDDVPTNKQLRRILTHMPIHGKALYLILSSSGMRIGEALAIDKDDDLDLSQTPVKVKIRGTNTKTGESRIAFISKEAKEAIEEWLKTRDQYLTSAAAKCKERSHYKAKFLGKDSEDNRLFPFELPTAYAIWTGAVTKAGFLKKDKQTNRNTLHPHVLRKFFRTRMATIVQLDVVEALMGHEGYLTEVYRRYSQEDLAKFYLQGELTLSVFTDGEEISKLRLEVEEKNKMLQNVVNELTLKNTRLENKLASLEGAVQEVREFQKGMNHFQKGGVVVTYHEATNFLPGELEEIADEVLTKHKAELEEEAKKIDELLKQRK